MNLRILGTVVLAVAGCAPAGRIATENESKYLESVPMDGKTTRQELVAAYGPPHLEFEQGRILMWRFRCEGPTPRITARTLEQVREDRRLGRWADIPYSLVAVFEGDTMLRHSLVRVR